MNNESTSRLKMALSFFGRLTFFTLIWMAVFFLPAGTFRFWEAWIVLAILVIPMVLGFFYWFKNDPALLARRSKTTEKEAEQKLIIKILSVFFVFTFLIPGFDQRFGWSFVPPTIVILADILLLIGYGMCFLVVSQNRFASRTIETEQNQTVISNGLYAIVRHPMYLGMVLMCVSLPLALGSYWAIIPAMLIIPVLVARIKSEESVLIKELKGYQEYLQKTKYRLIPGVW
jgi:protein-S-isoprenylcysteine O-methyltransferase Ste14